MNNLMFLAVDCFDCGGADVLRILKFVFILIDLVFFIVPIGLIIMLMIDFGKNVIAGKEDEMKKNLNMVIKRIIYCVVLFLVPTIANFAISLVGTDGENAVSTATACIGYAKEYTNEDLAKCEIDYETFKPVNEYSCYVCKDKEIYSWSVEQPADDYNGCTSGYLKSARTKDMCEVSKKTCWKCLDGSGYVLRDIQPYSGYKYTPETSFNYTTSVCGSGFYPEPVNDSYCTNEDE